MPNTIRQAHRPRVFVSGCYDLLHCGHVEFFRQAAEFGDLRNTHEDNSQRMLNALEPGIVLPIHRHRASSETVVIIRGKIRWIFYDENGNETERVLLDANGENRMLVVEKDRWHSLECLESGAVLFESKDGAYESLGEEDILTK